MTTKGPWDDYAAPAEDGPWADFEPAVSRGPTSRGHGPRAPDPFGAIEGSATGPQMRAATIDNTDRSWGDLFNDMGARFSSAVDNSAADLSEAPVHLLNALLHGASQLGTSGFRPSDPNVPSRVIAQPEITRQFAAGKRASAQQDAARVSVPGAVKDQALADADGLLGTLKLAVTHPSVLANPTADTAGYLVPGLAAGPGATEQLISQAVVAGASNAHQTEQYLVEHGMAPEDAARIAGDVFAASTAMNAVVPRAVPGGQAAETLLQRIVTGQGARATAGSAATRFLVPAVGEMVGEGSPEGLDQIIQNLATGQPIMSQVGQQTALGAILGAPGGVAAGTVDAMNGEAVGEHPLAEQLAGNDSRIVDLVNELSQAPARNPLSAAIGDALQTPQAPSAPQAAPTAAPEGAKPAQAPAGSAKPRVRANPDGTFTRPETFEGRADAATAQADDLIERLKRTGHPADAIAVQDPLAPRLPEPVQVEPTATREQLVAEHDAAQTDEARSTAAARIAAFDKGKPRGQAETETGRPGQAPVAQEPRAGEGGQADPNQAPAAVSGDRAALDSPIGQVAQQTVAKVQDAPKLVVHSTIDTLPDNIKDAANSNGGLDDGVEALYDERNDTIHVVAGNIDDSARAGWVVDHEIGHATLRSSLRRQQTGISAVLRRAVENPTIKSIVQSMEGQRPEQGATATEEAVVELITALQRDGWDHIEQRYGVKVPAEVRTGADSVIRKIVEAIRKILAKITGRDTFTDADVHSMLAKAQAERSRKRTNSTPKPESVARTGPRPMPNGLKAGERFTAEGERVPDTEFARREGESQEDWEARVQATQRSTVVASRAEGTPARAFLEDLFDTTASNPFGRDQLFLDDNRKPIAGVEMTKGFSPEVVYLNSIRTFEAGQGNGTTAMRKVTALADKHGVTLKLSAVPFGTKTLKKAELVKWYKRHGFVGNADQMTRMPKEDADARKATGEAAAVDPREAERARLDADKDGDVVLSRKGKNLYGPLQGKDLAGLPVTFNVPGRGAIEFHGFGPAQAIAKRFAAKHGNELPQRYEPANPQRGAAIAQAYEAMKHDPENAWVKRAYRALIDETLEQYDAIVATGLTVEFIEGEDPYAASPRLAILDVIENNHLWVFPTAEGFGSDDSFSVSGNPLLETTQVEISGKTAVANDIFRVVHDYFGHIANGLGFRADGEDNAWREHVGMYSPMAARAMTTETRGQNSVVNFGKYGEANKTANAADTRYADQKSGLLPEWVMNDELGPAQVAATIDADEDSAANSAPGPVRASRRPDAGRDRAPRIDAGREPAPWSHRPVQADAVAVVGRHYSNAAGLEALDGTKYGTQHQGAEAKRLTGPRRKALRNRVYFYPTDSALAARGESVVGRAATYTVNLANIYDAHSNDRLQTQVDRGQADDEFANDFEWAVIQAGYDGYRTADMVVALDTPPIPTTEADAPAVAASRKPRDPQTETAAFKRWFGDSKVVDAQGKPLRVYHGTDDAGSAFKTKAFMRDGSGAGSGIWFTSDRAIARDYAEGSASVDGDRPKIISAYLAIQNPYSTNNNDEFQNVPSAFRDQLEREGFDGIIGTYPGGEKEYIAFRPQQVKSATGNAGTFDPENPSIVASRAPRADDSPGVLRFVSALSQSVDRAIGAPKKADAQGWKGWLDGAMRRGEFKQSERDWLGLDDWLDSQGTVTRQQLAEYVAANQVQLEETILGSPDRNELPEGWALLSREDYPGEEADLPAWWVEDDEGNMRAEGDTRQEALEDAQDDSEADGDTKYAQYTLPGGDNYREVLLQLPVDSIKPASTASVVSAELVKGEDYDFWRVELRMPDGTMFGSQSDSENTREEAINIARRSAGRSVKSYTSSHWDQPNILAHIRLKDRFDADGKRVLFIEEIQSDWHQAGRKEGYATPKPPFVPVTELPPNVRVVDNREHGGGNTVVAYVDHGGERGEQWIGARTAQTWDDAAAVQEKGLALYNAWLKDQNENIRNGAVPNAPFKSSDEWAMLAFKRAIIDAAERGIPTVAWTTGDQQNERYSLDRFITAINATPSLGVLASDRQYDLVITLKDGLKENKDGVPERDLADLVGRDLAEKIIERSDAFIDSKRAYREAVRQSDSIDDPKVQRLGDAHDLAKARLTFTGLELRQGGDGMRGFYDTILPSAVNKWAKRFGGKVSAISLPDGDYNITSAYGAFQVRHGAAVISSHPTQAEAEESARAAAYGVPVHSLAVTDAMRDAALDGLPLFSRRVPLPPPSGVVPRSHQLDRAREVLQDRMLRLRRTQEHVGPVSDAMDAYNLENLMYGAAKDSLDAADRDLVKPLIELLKRTGLTTDQLQDYLLARHAPERNAKVASINPAMPDGGSGISTQDANAILAGTLAGPYAGKPLDATTRAHAAQAAKIIDQLRDRTLTTLEQSGQITPALAATLRATFQHYVPLRGDRNEPDWALNPPGTGKGLGGVRGAIKRALGRGDGNTAENLLGEMVADLQRAIVQGAKAKVTQAFLQFAKANPMPDLFTVEPVDMEWRYSKVTGQAYLAVKSQLSDADRSIVVPDQGKFVRIRFEDEALRDAMLHMSVNDFGAFVKYGGAINRWRSAVLTRFNPGFTPINVLRDLNFGVTALLAEQGGAITYEALRDYPAATAALWRDASKPTGDASVPDPSKTIDDWTREYSELGVKTGLTQAGDARDLQKQLSIASTTLMQLAAEGKALTTASEAVKRAVTPIAHLIEQANDATENALRLSAYIALRKKGWSPQKAGAYAKNLTINFNRKGKIGPILNALLLFYNASMQGTHAVVRVLKHPGVQAFLAGLAGLQAMLAAGMMGDDDDDGVTDWDTVPDYVKRTSLVIPLGFATGDGKDYAAIPMPYGFNLFPYSGGRLAQWAKQGARPTDNSLFADMWKSTTEAFIPLDLGQGYNGLFGDTIGTLMQLASNKDDLGRPISADNPYSDYQAPKALEGRPDTPRAYQAMSQLMAKMGGGDLEKRIPPIAYLDVAPEQLEFMSNYLLGGLGSITNKGARWWEQLDAGQLAGPMDYVTQAPIASRLLGSGNEARAVADRYYGERGLLVRDLDRLKDRVRSGQDADKALADLQGEDPALGGVTLDRYKTTGINKKTRASWQKGQIKLSETGAPKLKAKSGSAFEQLKDAEKAIEDINRAIRAVRSPETTNDAVVKLLADTIDWRDPKIAVPIEDPVLEAAGLPVGYTGAAIAPNRVRQRAIRALQDYRERKQKGFLRQLKLDRGDD